MFKTLSSVFAIFVVLIYPFNNLLAANNNSADLQNQELDKLFFEVERLAKEKNDSSLIFLKSAELLIKNSKELKFRESDLQLYKGIYHYYLKDIEKASPLIEESLEKRSKNHNSYCKSLLYNGRIQLKEGKDSMSIASFNLALEVAKVFKLEKLIPELYFNGIAYFYYKKRDWHKFIEIAPEAVEKIKQQQNNKLLYKAMRDLGCAHFFIKNYLDAEKYFRQQFEIAKQLKNDIYLAEAYSNIGIIYNVLGQKEECIEYYFRARSIFEKTNNLRSKATVSQNIAELYLEQGQNEKARDLYEKAIKDYKEHYEKEQDINLVVVLNAYKEYIKTLIQLKSYFEAEEQVFEVLDFAHSNNFKGNLFFSSLHNLLAEIYQGIGDFAKVEEHFNKVIEYYNKSDQREKFTFILVAYGKYLINNNNVNKGLFYCEKAIAEISATKKNTIGQKIDCHECLELGYKQAGNYKNTYFHANKAMILRDSVVNKKNIVKLTEASMSFKFEAEKLKDSIKINNLELGLAKNNLALGKKKNAITLLFLLSSVATILFLLFFYKFNLKQKFNVELTHLNKSLNTKTNNLNKAIIEIRESNIKLNNQLSQNAIFLSHKNILIEQVIDYAKKIESPSLRRSLLSHLRQNQNESDFQELSTLLENSNRHFLQALSSRYPGLSSSELSLCIYLKMNMSTKEIEALTLKNNNSIRMARYRLRKKFGISSSNGSISAFLNSLTVAPVAV